MPSRINVTTRVQAPNISTGPALRQSSRATNALGDLFGSSVVARSTAASHSAAKGMETAKSFAQAERFYQEDLARQRVKDARIGTAAGGDPDREWDEMKTRAQQEAFLQTRGALVAKEKLGGIKERIARGELTEEQGIQLLQQGLSGTSLDDTPFVDGALPAILHGVQQLEDAGRVKRTQAFIEERTLTASNAIRQVAIDAFDPEVIAGGEAPDYWTGYTQARNAYLTMGGEKRDFNKLYMDTMLSTAIEQRNPALLDLLEEKRPNGVPSAAESVLGGSYEVVKVREQLERALRQDEATAKREKAEELDEAFRAWSKELIGANLDSLKALHAEILEDSEAVPFDDRDRYLSTLERQITRVERGESEVQKGILNGLINKASGFDGQTLAHWEVDQAFGYGDIDAREAQQLHRMIEEPLAQESARWVVDTIHKDVRLFEQLENKGVTKAFINNVTEEVTEAVLEAVRDERLDPNDPDKLLKFQQNALNHAITKHRGLRQIDFNKKEEDKPTPSTEAVGEIINNFNEATTVEQAKEQLGQAWDTHVEGGAREYRETNTLPKWLATFGNPTIQREMKQAIMVKAVAENREMVERAETEGAFKLSQDFEKALQGFKATGNVRIEVGEDGAKFVGTVPNPLYDHRTSAMTLGDPWHDARRHRENPHETTASNTHTITAIMLGAVVPSNIKEIEDSHGDVVQFIRDKFGKDAVDTFQWLEKEGYYVRDEENNTWIPNTDHPHWRDKILGGGVAGPPRHTHQPSGVFHSLVTHPGAIGTVSRWIADMNF